MSTYCVTCGPGQRVATRHRRHCAGCGSPICADHVWIRVDEANESITRNSPPYCADCAEQMR